MKFTKMHGIGNDYVYINCLEEEVKDPAALARRVSDRHFGIGSDGLILIRPSAKADFMMDMYNADGSRSEMCGNGIRCVGKYVYDKGLTDQTSISIETLAGIKRLELIIEAGAVSRVKVDMGEPELIPAKIPVLAEGDRAVDIPIEVDGKGYTMTCVSMGNPHAVVFIQDVEHFPLEKTGPLFENHPCFPNRVNTEFIEVLDAHTMRMRVWERGTGETLACGTGACAAAVAARLNGLTSGGVTVRLLGGDLFTEWDQRDNHVYMTGPAAISFEGELPD